MCNKISYETKTDALADSKLILNGARYFKGKEKKPAKKLKAYLCPECDKWHLTTNRKNKEYKRFNKTLIN